MGRGGGGALLALLVVFLTGELLGASSAFCAVPQASPSPSPSPKSSGPRTKSKPRPRRFQQATKPKTLESLLVTKGSDKSPILPQFLRKKKKRKKDEVSRGDAITELQSLVENLRRNQMMVGNDCGTSSETPFVDLAKRCYRSELPELAVEAFALYAGASGQAPSSTLTLTAIRSHLAMRNIYEGLLLLQTASETHNVRFDPHAKSSIIVGLCNCGRPGVDAALQMRKGVIEANSTLTATASWSLMESVAGLHSDKGEVLGHEGGSHEHWYTYLRKKASPRRANLLRLSATVAGVPLDIAEVLHVVENIIKDMPDKSREWPVGSLLVRAAFGSTLAKLGALLGPSLGDTEIERERQRRGRMCLSAAKEALARNGLDWDIGSATAALQECLALRDTQGAEEVLGIMRTEQLRARTSTFNVIIKYYREVRDAHGALRTLSVLRRAQSAQPDETTFALVMQACAWSGSRLKEALELMDEAAISQSSAAFILRSKALWDARVMLAHAAGDPPVEDVLREMVAAGYEPDEITASSIIKACAEQQDAAFRGRVLSLFEDMRKGTSFLPRPTHQVCVSLLRACLGNAASTDGSADLDTAQTILQYMWDDFRRISSEGKPVKGAAWSPLLRRALLFGPTFESMPPAPDAQCYELVIKACIKSGRLDAALERYREMESFGIVSTEPILALLVQGFGARLDLDNALGVWEELSSRFPLPSRSSFETAIDVCVSHPGGLQPATALIEQMKRAGHSLAASHYATLIRGFRDARNLEGALKAFRDMNYGFSSTLGFEVPEDIFAALLEATLRSGEVDDIPQALVLLKSHGVKPPRHLMTYLEIDSASSELYEQIFGKRTGKNPKTMRSRERRFGMRGTTTFNLDPQDTPAMKSTSMAYSLLEEGLSGLDKITVETENGHDDVGNGDAKKRAGESITVKVVDVPDRNQRKEEAKRAQEGKSRSIERRRAERGQP
jgi:pentatricopeptide repeat protein